ncbi:MAG: NYN domain-containing protein [Oscillospiraceae bacterium]|nr:NYN domain-containing protein [Oscillospiraceae bacterium]
MTTNALNLSNLRLAVLIDAENVPRKSMKRIMEEIAIYGTPTIKRIYGDWTSPVVSGWKSSLLENAITPIQQYSYTTGKNSSDSAMIIDAMDILYTEKTDGFVLISSDSDFTRLAIRLREAGQRVIGIGERKTPSAFIAACDKFTYIEVIYERFAEADTGDGTGNGSIDGSQENFGENGLHNEVLRQNGGKPNSLQRSKSEVSAHGKNGKVSDTVIELIAGSVSDLAGEDGYAFMGELGNLILKKQPDFDHRNFGYKSLSAMIKSIDRFEMDFRHTTDPNIKHVFVKDKES